MFLYDEPMLIYYQVSARILLSRNSLDIEELHPLVYSLYINTHLVIRYCLLKFEYEIDDDIPLKITTPFI